MSLGLVTKNSWSYLFFTCVLVDLAGDSADF